jgi:hypothetical protein
MFTSLVAQPKAQLALLDAYYPEWRFDLDHYSTGDWIAEWMGRTQVSRSTAFRWHAIARRHHAGELTNAA